MKIYTIIGGVNGAGKNSLTGVLKAETNDLGTVIDVNKLAASLGGSNLKAGKAAVQKIGRLLEQGASFTQETTLAGRKTEQTTRKARERGYYVRLYYIGLNSADESIKRIANRVAKGGHDIPQEDVYRRFGSRFDSLLRVLPLCDEAAFYDNENGFVEVANYQNGEIIPKGDYRPAWLRELMEYATREQLG